MTDDSTAVTDGAQQRTGATSGGAAESTGAGAAREADILDRETWIAGIRAQILSPEGAGRTTGLAGRLGIRVTELSVERVAATMPVEGNQQPYGYLHGGASAALAETLGSFGATLHAGPGRQVVGVELNATHHRSATQGHVTGVATPLHLGRSMTTHEVVITDDRGRRVCTARLTCFLKDR